VQNFAVGDQVGYYRSQGSYASERLIETADLLRLPRDVSSEQAAALMVKGFMAWLVLGRAFQVEAGDTVLVTTAAGGIGSLVVRLALFLGASVIGVVGSEAKRQAALDNGAVEVAVGLDEAIHRLSHRYQR
jgi:NADPH2:quinone reductase